MIDKYLISNCLFVIEEFNERYRGKSKEELKRVADEEFSEADLVMRLGYPFRQMASFNMQGKAQDIVVKSLDFVIEVKFLRNWKSTSGNTTNKITWKELNKDFEWLWNEIKGGQKGKRAFIIGWFNAVKFSEIVQLGKGSGWVPDIDEDKIRHFPFLNSNGPKTKDIFYMYPEAYKELPVKIPGYAYGVGNCMFFGKETDLYHMAMYW
ncbi:hypothetical protein [Brevibacillus marinus]|uniref:hypothetical protein n=1 Tax=Brevibacillus marinus TaxID=2496837 RepID=UPI000F83E743|nr:hypothetical protein [Brevibacillus marinus]